MPAIDTAERSRAILGAALTTALLLSDGVQFTAAHSQAWPETLMLDTRGPAVTTTHVLTAAAYRISVSGTYSAWTAGSWGAFCGAPESLPMTPSAGVTNGRVGLDAEAWFAAAACGAGDTLCCCNVPCPRHHPFFRMDLGSGWSHIEPVGGPHGSPSIGHIYEYRIAGQNSAVSFLNYDDIYSDNYGVLTIVVDSLAPVSAGERGVDPLSLSLVAIGTTGTIEVSFALPAADAAMIELFDVSGRRVDLLEVAPGSRGHHRARLGTASLPSGVYFVRLAQGNDVVVKKICVIH